MFIQYHLGYGITSNIVNTAEDPEYSEITSQVKVSCGLMKLAI